MNDDRPPDADVESAIEATGRESGAESISTDELHRLLASSRRRYVLSYLQSRPGERVAFDDLVSGVAERERPDPGPSTHRERVGIDLHHVHLPKLVEAGVVSYDPVDRTVVYDPTEELEAVLARSLAIGTAEE